MYGQLPLFARSCILLYGNSFSLSLHGKENENASLKAFLATFRRFLRRNRFHVPTTVPKIFSQIQRNFPNLVASAEHAVKSVSLCHSSCGPQSDDSHPLTPPTKSHERHLLVSFKCHRVNRHLRVTCTRKEIRYGLVWWAFRLK